MANTEQELVPIFKALADENRLQILNLLRSGEKCACRLLEEMHISQPTLSHHMKILCDAGLVTGRREGKWMHYSIRCEGVCNVRSNLQQLLSPDTISQDCDCTAAIQESR